jgi:hypothetical protein
MIKRRVKLTFPPELIKEPIIYNLGHRFGVVTNIRRADINRDKGWVVLELERKVDDKERGIAWITGKGVRVDPTVVGIAEG